MALVRLLASEVRASGLLLVLVAPILVLVGPGCLGPGCGGLVDGGEDGGLDGGGKGTGAPLDGGADAGDPDGSDGGPAADGGGLDGGPHQDLDGGAPDAGLTLGLLGEGSLCGWQRERFPLSLAPGVVYDVTLAAPGNSDPDLIVYRASRPHHAVLIARAFGDDVVHIMGEVGDAFVAEVSSPYGDCEDWRLEVAPSALQASAFTTLTGSVHYEDLAYDATGFTGDVDLLSTRGARVELYREDSLVVATTTTDEGSFALPVVLDEGADYRLRVLAVLEAFGQWSRVRDRSSAQAVYAVEGPVFTANDTSPLTVTAPASDVGGAFNILDATRDGFALIARSTGALSPTLTVAWQRGQPFGCGSCYGNNRISLGGQIEDPDEYDDDIVLHELGHYWASHYAPDDSPGGSHRDMRVEPRLAWGEGLAYFFAGLAQGTPMIVDNYLDDHRVTDLDAMTLDGEIHPDFYGSSDGTLLGDLREEIPGGQLWDAFDDDDAETFDDLALGEQGVMRALMGHFSAAAQGLGDDVGPPGADLADWLHALVCREPASAAAVETLLVDRDLLFPNDVESAACPEKTRRDEPPLTVTRVGHHLHVDVHRAAGASIEVGVLAVDGTLRPGQRRFCASPCFVEVARGDAHWVAAHLDGQRVLRTNVPPARADAFRGGGRLVEHEKLGALRVWPARR